MQTTAIALTVAGSDSGGGAGIQADLKTFAALGSYGCSAITALTAQNTHRVYGILDVSPDFIQQQLYALFTDLAIEAMKIGMVSQPSAIEVIASTIDQYQPRYVVLDPVAIATSGDRLTSDHQLIALKEKLIPKAHIITPNLFEAALLLNYPIPESLDDMTTMIPGLLDLGAKSVLLKGGHLNSSRAIELYHDGHRLIRLESNYFPTRNTHGTGCTLSAAITALLSQGYTMNEAIPVAKQYITQAIAHADKLSVGTGSGPVHHFYNHWKDNPNLCI